MKTVVRWQGKPAPHDWEFMGTTSDGYSAEMAARKSEGAEKAAASPKELVAFGQAGCTAIDVVSTLQKMRQNLRGLEISCDITQTKEYPVVFDTCRMRYEVSGDDLDVPKVAHAVELSLLKYCGVSAMIERSGCRLRPELRINGHDVSIWDPLGVRSSSLRDWAGRMGEHCPNGIALVTGASRGIGRALSRRLCELGYAVLPVARGKANGERGSSEYEMVYLDLTTELSRFAVLELVRNSGVRIGLAVHNAGILEERATNASEVDYFELRRVFETNLFATADFNRELAPLMGTGSTILFVSSYMGLPSSNDFDFSSYRLSKCALTLYAREYGREMLHLKRDVAVAALHPGSVCTQMNPEGDLSVEQSAHRICLLLAKGMRSAMLERNGDFWMVSAKEDAIKPWTI
jgi:putative redox protein